MTRRSGQCQPYTGSPVRPGTPAEATALRNTTSTDDLAKVIHDKAYHCLRFAPLIIVLAMAACVRNTTHRTTDLVQIARQTIAVVERHELEKVTVIAPESMATDSVQAFAHVRTVVARNGTPEQIEFEIPLNHFLLESVEITEDEALVKGVLGPLRRSSGPRDFQGCGAIYSIRLNKIEGVWTPVRMQEGRLIAEAEEPTVC